VTDPTAQQGTDPKGDSLERLIAGLTLRRALGGAVVILAVIVALSITVGFWAAGGEQPEAVEIQLPDGTTQTIHQFSDVEAFNWEVASIFGTAVGTTLLALVTGLLAIGTWKDVRASQSMVELTRAEQDERIRPVVIGGVVGATISGAQAGRLYSVTAKVGLTNVGGGPAVRVEAEVIWTGSAFVGEAGAIRADGQVIRAIRAGQDVDDIVFVMKGDMQADEFRAEDLHVVGSYRDRLGNPAGSILDWTKSVTVKAPTAGARAEAIAPTIETEIDDGPQIF
jgi:hypothetical protein